MACAPHTGSPLELHVRHMPGGVFTDHVFGAGATQMKVREILRLEGPFGSFFLREDSDKPIVLLASGTGFAPVKARSEEHTSELQSLMRISYAVLCLKKKKTYHTEIKAQIIRPH